MSDETTQPAATKNPACEILENEIAGAKKRLESYRASLADYERRRDDLKSAIADFELTIAELEAACAKLTTTE